MYQTQNFNEDIVTNDNNKVRKTTTHDLDLAENVVRQVWKTNLNDEFKNIGHLIKIFNHVAIRIEHPVVMHSNHIFTAADFNYQLIRCNIDLFHIIQLGLTFMDTDGNTPPGYSTWQFNFKFNLGEETSAKDYLNYLENSGIQLKKHEEDGIEPLELAELLMASSMSMDNIRWLSFDSDFDFGYMLKLLTSENLPYFESEFFDLLKLHFKTIYNVKYLVNLCKNLKGDLQEVADQLKLCRIGRQYQAGSNSHLTRMIFFKIREILLMHGADTTADTTYDVINV